MSEKPINNEGADISLGTIVDNDLDFLKEHISNKDLGYVISVRNLLAVAYDELAHRKNGVITKRKEFVKKKDNESAEGCTILVQNIYSKMQSIEDKHTYLSEYIDKTQSEVMKNTGN